MRIILLLLLLPAVLSLPMDVNVDKNRFEANEHDLNLPHPDLNTTPPQMNGSPSPEEKVVVIGEEMNNIDENLVREALREMKERNVNVLERNGLRVEKRGSLVTVREVNKTEVLPRVLEEKVKKVSRLLGVELNEIGRRVVVREGNRAIIVAIKENVVVGKKVERKEQNTFSVEIVVAPEVNGLVYVREEIEKGEGSVEMNLFGPYVIIDFDPVVAWVVEVNGEATLSYTVKNGYPKEVEPFVATLASCDVEIKFLDVEEREGTLVGKFQILLSGVPVSTPEVKVNGDYVFFRDGMYYYFQSEGRNLVVEGSVGDCRFYRELQSPPSNVFLVGAGLAVFALLAVVLLHVLRR